MKKNPEERLGYEDTLHIFKHKFFEKYQDLVISIIEKHKIKKIKENKLKKGVSFIS